MNNDLKIRCLRESDTFQMYKCFMLAFSDYQIPFEMTYEGFIKKFVEKLNLDFNHSVGAFKNAELVGFIFIAIQEYEGSLTAYNGGTGVVPGERGQGIAKELFYFLKPRLSLSNVNRCVLEALTNNQPALQTYQSLNFKRTKLLKCYRLLPYRYNPPAPNHIIRIKNATTPDWVKYCSFFDFTPSFIDSPKMIDNNLANESIIEATIGDELAGYAIYQPVLGRISHLSVDPAQRNKGVGSALMHEIYLSSRNKYLTIINLPEKAEVTQKFLTNLGFENQLDQYEMALSLQG